MRIIEANGYLPKKETFNAQFRRRASAVLNLIAIRFDSSEPEARL